MKRICFVCIVLVLALAGCDNITDGAYGGNQAGNNPSTNPGGNNPGGTNPGNPWQPQTVTVAQARTLPDDSPVRLTGRVTAYLGRDEKFTFADSTGSITVEIDYEEWVRGGFNPPPTRFPVSVEITGEVDREFNSVEIDVESIRGL